MLLKKENSKYYILNNLILGSICSEIVKFIKISNKSV